MICMENFKEDDWDKVMICSSNGHPFHDTCILQWLNNQNNPLCPICKQPWFGDPVPVRRNNVRRTQVVPQRRPIPVSQPGYPVVIPREHLYGPLEYEDGSALPVTRQQVPDPPGFRERLRRIRDNIRNGTMRLPERIRRQLREHRRRRRRQNRCVLQGGN